MTTFTAILKGIGDNWPGALLLLIAVLAVMSLMVRTITIMRLQKASEKNKDQGEQQSRLSEDGWLDRITRSITDYRRLLGLLVALGLPALCWYLIQESTLEEFHQLLVILSENWNGAIMLMLVGFAAIWSVGKLSQVFAFGRHEPRTNADGTDLPSEYSNVFSIFISKIINQFRHLLALVVVLIFAIALIVAMCMAHDITELSDTLQAVMATLGGLVGSIIGYYFGESKGESSGEQETVNDQKVPTTTTGKQTRPADGSQPADIIVPEPPPGL